MPGIIEPTTARLQLRQWRQQDLPVFANMNADPQVMKYFPAIPSVDESNALAMRIESLISEQGWGLWAIEEKDSGCFIGFTGLHTPKSELPCAPCIEIGWRLARLYWGKGYAYEAAIAALDVAFRQLMCAQVFSFTAMANRRSQALMQRLGMVNTGQNFEHPDIPVAHHLREHVLYRLTKTRWKQRLCSQHLDPGSYSDSKGLLQ
jgi:RimJ/RimL family protein N-acetyltransferase